MRVRSTLDARRRGWLAPEGLSDDELRKRTLTILYSDPPAWLRQAHASLDEAVHRAYGWPHPLPEDDLLTRLIDLNAERAARGATDPPQTTVEKIGARQSGVH